jgi:hypothetical protein
MPEDSLAPLGLATGLSVLFISGLVHVWWGVGLGLAIVAAALIAWFWPIASPRPHAGSIDG